MRYPNPCAALALALLILGFAGTTKAQLAINQGGTNATSQTTNGINYFDGSKITSGSIPATLGNQALTISPTGNPTGNPPPPALTSLSLQTNAASSSDREYLFACGLTSALGDGGGASNDKVCGYFGMVGNSGSADIWSLNTLAQANTGFFQNTHVMQGIEVDLNNDDKDVTITATPSSFSAPYSAGINISGNADKRNTVGVGVMGGKFQFGFLALGNVSQAAYYENVASTYGLDLEGGHATAGLKISNSSVSGIFSGSLAVGSTATPIGGGILDAEYAQNQHMVIRGPQNFTSGVALSSLNDANSAFQPLELQASSFDFTNGNVGIGTTSPSDTLHVNGSVAGTSAYNNLSDARLKKDVTEITGGLALIEKMRGVRFRWRKPEERQIGNDLSLPVDEPQVGFVAQEVEPVLPEAVTHTKDGIRNIQESKIVPLLVEAVKEQQAQIAELTAAVRTLKAANDNRRQKVDVIHDNGSGKNVRRAAQ